MTKEMFRTIGLLIFCAALICVGGYELYGWHQTGQLAMHAGLHRPLSYTAEPGRFVWEFGTYLGMLFLGLLGIVGCFYFRVWR